MRTKQDPPVAGVCTITPGTWEYDPSGKYYQGAVVRSNGMVICRMLDLGYESHGDKAANAQLIAAAPDMLAALKALVIDANRLCDRQLGGTYEADCLVALIGAKEVIAKAEGRAQRTTPMRTVRTSTASSTHET